MTYKHEDIVSAYQDIVRSHRKNFQYFISEGWPLPIPRSMGEHEFLSNELHAVMCFHGHNPNTHELDVSVSSFILTFGLEGMVRSDVNIHLSPALEKSIQPRAKQAGITVERDQSHLRIKNESARKILVYLRGIISDQRPEHEFDLLSTGPASDYEKNRYNKWSKAVNHVLKEEQ